MQVEIRCALDFLLSYLYDKLPRRRVNLFGDELEKYLKLKLITSDSKICLNINFKHNNMELIDPCLIAASKESAMDLKEILECWPAQLKLFIENGVVSYSLDQDLNQNDEFNSKNDQIKIIYNEKNTESSSTVPSISAHSVSPLQQELSENQLFDTFHLNQNNQIDYNIQQQSRRIFKNDKILNSPINAPSNANCNNSVNNLNNVSSQKSGRGLNLNFNNLKPTNNNYNSPSSPGSFNNQPIGNISPFQHTDFLSLSSSSSSASTSSLSSHLSNPIEEMINQHVTSPINSNIATLTGNAKLPHGNSSMFTTAAFAQTKFGSTKSKNNYTRQTKQQKMLPNEFSAYIRNKVKMLNTTNGQYQNQLNLNNGGEGFINYSLMNDQVPSISLSSYTTPMSSQTQSSSFFKNGLPTNVEMASYDSAANNVLKNFKYNANSSNSNATMDAISPGSQSQLIQPDLLISNSTMNELEENLINNYFSSTFSSPNSSTTSTSSASSSSSSASSYNNDHSKMIADSNTNAINELLTANNSLLNQINNLTI